MQLYAKRYIFKKLQENDCDNVSTANKIPLFMYMFIFLINMCKIHEIIINFRLTHVVWISSEFFNILIHPLQGQTLVFDSVIPGS